MGENVVSNVFTSAQLTSITEAMNTAITNVLSMFVSLTPIMAVIAGVGFGIKSYKIVPLHSNMYA